MTKEGGKDESLQKNNMHDFEDFGELLMLLDFILDDPPVDPDLYLLGAINSTIFTSFHSRHNYSEATLSYQRAQFPSFYGIYIAILDSGANYPDIS
ncbi:hypothetical protein FOMG_14724 [Fusarium oxysporum f. sp. melonis 26406]|uniref:Uncharacterized protein n=1 Tax=Fusarium oxysporum f. sp. melonis 26406 TaxID=1089452 RepID=W9ZJR5_FUSOX|nr:hypothetical protein FOMG_14724 [Fusarium oxysporum f. sp. melonis 26406]